MDKMKETIKISHSDVCEKLKKIFDSACKQNGNQNLVERTKKLYNSITDKDIFLDEFTGILRYILIYHDKEAANKILLFISKFVASLYCTEALLNDSEEMGEELENPFVNGLLNFLSKMHWATAVEARLRCVTLVHHILTAMPEHSYIPVEMWKILSDMVRSRIQDKNSQVRVAAILVAKKLQEPKNSECLILKLLSFHMSDPAPAVRRAVVNCIALTRTTILQILQRTLDVNENVRRNVYAVIAKIRFLNLTIAQRVTFLERGLQDRAERVRACVENILIPQWMGHVNRDIIKFLEAIDAVNCPEVAVLVLAAVFKNEHLSHIMKYLPLDPEIKTVPLECLNPETALLWRCLAEYLKKQKLEEELEGILPNVTTFCDFVKSFFPLEEIGNEQPLSDDEQWAEFKLKCTLRHLLELAKLFDFRDEAGRINLRKLIISLLISQRTSDVTVKDLVGLFRLIITDTNDFFQSMIEAVSDIREPLQHVAVEPASSENIKKEYELSGHKLMLNELKEKEYEAVRVKDYDGAASLKVEIEKLETLINDLITQPTSTLCEVREEKNDPETICKCLTIIIQMMKISEVHSLMPALRTLQEDFLTPCLRSEDLLTQSLAVQALGQFCALDIELAQNNLLSFLFMISESGYTEVSVPALKAVFDIFQVHGMGAFANLDETKLNDSDNEKTINCPNIDAKDDEDTNRPGAKCISLLKELLNCTTNDELKCTAFEGFCKLLLTGAIYSPSLLKTIIIKGFSPIQDCEFEDRIRQIFMVFFPMFARVTKRSQDMIEAAFLPIMRTLNDAQLGTPEVDINPRDVATFLIDHTKPGINHATNAHIHNLLAISICLEILRDSSLCVDLGFDQNYLKALFSLQIEWESETFTQQLLLLLGKISKEVKNSGSQKLVKLLRLKFNENINKQISSIQNTLQTTKSDSVQQSCASNQSSINMNPPTPLSTSPVRTSEQIANVDLIPDNLTADDSVLENNAISERQNCIVAESPEVTDDSDVTEPEVYTPAPRNRRVLRKKLKS